MNILAVGAHPDDIEVHCAGTLALYAQRGDKVTMAIATNGEVGHPNLPNEEVAKIRYEEQKQSAVVIGAEVIWMGFKDQDLFDGHETRLAFINMVRKVKPDLIITHWEQDYSSDHNTTGRIIQDINTMVTVPNIKTEYPPCENAPATIFMDTASGVGFLPEEYVDITSTFSIKQEMFSKHKSQGLWLEDQYGMGATKNKDSLSTEVQDRFRGKQAGVKYAEAYRFSQRWPRKIIYTLLP